MVGIVTNTAALIAQNNLDTASSQSQSSIARLSSGNAIVRASDNVAGLAVGTILETNVSTLQAAQTNATQANSLLGVADGALQNIQTILQRQKTLASEATSGSLTDQERGYLNQEFQNLTSQINQIAGTTNFNGINLLDGSLYAPSTVSTQTTQTATATAGTVTLNAAAGGTAALAAGDTIVIGEGTNTVTLTVGSTAAGTYTGNPFQIDEDGTNGGFQAGAAGSVDASNILQAIKNIENSTNDSAADATGTTVAQAKLILSGMTFTQGTGTAANTIQVSSNAAGTAYNSGGANAISFNFAGVAAASTAGSFTVNGNDAGTAAVDLSTGGTAGTGDDSTSTPPINGYLSAGTFSTKASKPYGGTATTVATGTVKDDILSALDFASGTTTGVNFAGISNNAAFNGTISGFTATYTQPGYADLSVTVGGTTYTATNVNTAPTAATQVQFNSTTPGQGYFDLTIADSTASGQTAIANQSDANNFATRINQALSGVTADQTRQVSSYTGVGAVYNSSGTAIGNLTGSSVSLTTGNFANLQIQSLNVTPGSVNGSVQPQITAVINGQTFESGFNPDGSANATPFTIGATTITLAAGASLSLRNVSDPTQLLTFQNGQTALDVTSADNLDSFQKSLSSALGVGKGGSSLTFQVGTDAQDSINVQIQGTTSQDIYQNSDGQSQSLDISTLAGAQTASTILDNAINTVTTIDANVGALESRFNYASSNLSSSIQNQQAAEGTFLNTDIAAESTNFASEQVRLQASISVLAQANQLPQNLLKLLS